MGFSKKFLAPVNLLVMLLKKNSLLVITPFLEAFIRDIFRIGDFYEKIRWHWEKNINHGKIYVRAQRGNKAKKHEFGVNLSRQKICFFVS